MLSFSMSCQSFFRQPIGKFCFFPSQQWIIDIMEQWVTKSTETVASSPPLPCPWPEKNDLNKGPGFVFVENDIVWEKTGLATPGGSVLGTVPAIGFTRPACEARLGNSWMDLVCHLPQGDSALMDSGHYCIIFFVGVVLCSRGIGVSTC